MGGRYGRRSSRGRWSRSGTCPLDGAHGDVRMGLPFDVPKLAVLCSSSFTPYSAPATRVRRDLNLTLGRLGVGRIPERAVGSG